jgi:hypothetical protein
MKQEDLKVGDKVYYSSFSKIENGIVKEIPKHDDIAVFVVYHCDGNWDRFEEYTGALTYIFDLSLGWKEEAFKEVE